MVAGVELLHYPWRCLVVFIGRAFESCFGVTLGIGRPVSDF